MTTISCDRNVEKFFSLQVVVWWREMKTVYTKLYCFGREFLSLLDSGLQYYGSFWSSLTIDTNQNLINCLKRYNLLKQYMTLKKDCYPYIKNMLTWSRKLQLNLRIFVKAFVQLYCIQYFGFKRILILLFLSLLVFLLLSIKNIFYFVWKTRLIPKWWFDIIKINIFLKKKTSLKTECDILYNKNTCFIAA